jgi:hypothetical protein
MINFRFHIVSLTAAFLAFAVGLLLGTNFLADASKDYLENRIDDFAQRLKDEKATNSRLKQQFNSLQNEDRDLDQQLGERLFPGVLRSEPVLVIAPRGLSGDPNPVDRVSDSLLQASADPVGVWWLTDRLKLDDDGEVTDLAAILGASTTKPDDLRKDLAKQLADVVSGSTDAGPSTTSIRGSSSEAEPELLSRLHDAGFVDYDMPKNVKGDNVQLPISGLRVVVITGQGAAVPDNEVLYPMLQRMASDGPVPVVVSQTPLISDDANAAPTEPLVTALRHDGNLKGRITTVDDLDRVSGRIATVLALQDATPGSPTVGHFGLRDDAQRLLPEITE